MFNFDKYNDIFIKYVDSKNLYFNKSALLYFSMVKNTLDNDLKNKIIFLIKNRDKIFNGKNNFNGDVLFLYSLYSIKDYLDEKLYKNLIDFTKLKVCKYIMNNNEITMEKMDCVSGEIGMARCLLVLGKSDCISKQAIQKTMDDCIQLILNDYNLNDLQSGETKYIKTGIAHGVAGILAFLAIAKSNGFNHLKYEIVIKKLILFFKKNMTYTENFGYVWPAKWKLSDYINNKIVLDNKYPHSWCYGAMGILNSILLAAETINDINTVNWAKQVITKNFSTINIKKQFFSPIICHGYAGFALQLYHFKNYWCIEGLEKYESEIDNIIYNYICSCNNENYIFYNVQVSFDQIYISNDIDSVLDGQFSLILALLSIQKKDVILNKMLLLE